MMGNGLTLRLETVTPLHIGNGDILSPYSDYIFDDETGMVYIIDPHKVEKALYEMENNEEVIDEFVQRISAKKYTSDVYTLKHFFKEYGLDYKQLARSAVQTNADVKNEEIQECIKSSARPFIPGSSIKGAVRTSLLFIHRQEDGFSLDDVPKNIKQSNGEDLFGEFEKDLLKHLHISDSTMLKPDEIMIVKTLRFDFKKKTGTIPVTKEAIPENTQLTFRLQCKAKRNYHSLDKRFSYLYSEEGENGERKILNMVNSFYKQLIEKEWNLLKELKIPELSLVTDLYEKLLKSAQQFEKEQNGAVMRLGSGKTFYDNTIAGLFSPQDLKKIRNKTNLGSYLPFPRTRSVIQNGQVYESVLGWVYIMI